ncbi:hypothetical protein GTP58_09435 [Duganella sp. CY15W]|uniref:hypothetical protein n=1 Tax=Duganella sp. CY15W TaxID=2692172 RepID=UPI001369156D|nr:hypothetical protein [Duganella sp. CY15W]MYM28544.1 hypothetical protein [Duganella sp. CY15W]
MRKAKHNGATHHVGLLSDATQAAYKDANRSLQDLALQCQPAIRCASAPDIQYSDGSVAVVIPAASFHRNYALCLHTLELTVYGYCVSRKAGWERRIELDFSMRRPPWWRRILRRPPLLALDVQVLHESVRVRIRPAPADAMAPRSRYVFQLGATLQNELETHHTTQLAARSVPSRLRAWMSSFRQKQ